MLLQVVFQLFLRLQKLMVFRYFVVLDFLFRSNFLVYLKMSKLDLR